MLNNYSNVHGESFDQNDVSEPERKAALDDLSKIHPDWVKVTNSKQFKQWAKGLPHATQDKLNSSWDAAFIAGVISQYKLTRKKMH